jgi:uncharacterized protein
MRGMWDGLEKLLELQKHDLAIAKLETEARAIPPGIQALEGRLTHAKAGAEAAQAETERLQRERRSKERELEEAVQGTKKKQARLYEIKTNEEYAAVLKEVEVLKEKSSRLETEILEMFEAADAAAKVTAEADKVLEAAVAVRDTERSVKEERLAQLRRELAGLQEKRKALTGRLDPDLLQHYSRLMRGRGEAVVAVLEGSCGGCGIALTPQAYAEVRRNDRMFNCSSCSRIIYFPG